ncbi:MAG: hypothetical protein II755_03095 [Prevotella sp.]|nr:hypothetical protein [Prevotella sp.]
MLLAFFCMAYASILQDEVPVVMTEKVVNPNGSQNDPQRSPDATLVIYQSGRTFHFGETYAGNAVTLLLNEVEVYSGLVGNDGTVTFPESLIGTFELILTVGTTVYGAFVTL